MSTLSAFQLDRDLCLLPTISLAPVEVQILLIKPNINVFTEFLSSSLQAVKLQMMQLKG
jgi:hypothetical protein